MQKDQAEVTRKNVGGESGLGAGEELPDVLRWNMGRRGFLRSAGLAALGAGMMGFARDGSAQDAPAGVPWDISKGRPPVSQRKFTSQVVEQYILATQKRIGDRALAALFANCFPNTLDTTVEPGSFDGKPDTAVVTGDIAAMWLRDSSAQVWPYLPLTAKDPALRRLLEGVIRRQTRCILIDPYANAFMADLSAPPLSWSRHDKTEMKQGVGERKWELDSLCYPIRLAHGYWKQTGDTAPFDAEWHSAMRLVVETMRVEQRKHGDGPYRFQRTSDVATETLPNGGYGNPVRPVGLIASGFRNSDDACIFPFQVPSNLFAVTSLRQLAAMARLFFTTMRWRTTRADWRRRLLVLLVSMASPQLRRGPSGRMRWMVTEAKF